MLDDQNSRFQGLSWFICYIGLKYPSVILDHTFRICLEKTNPNITSPTPTSNSSTSNSAATGTGTPLSISTKTTLASSTSTTTTTTPSSSASGSTNKKIVSPESCLQILEYLSLHSMSQISLIIKNHLENILVKTSSTTTTNLPFLQLNIPEIKKFLLIISKCKHVFEATLPILFEFSTEEKLKQFSMTSPSATGSENKRQQESQITISSIELLLNKLLVKDTHIFTNYASQLVSLLYQLSNVDNESEPTSSTPSASTTTSSSQYSSSAIATRLFSSLLKSLQTHYLQIHSQTQLPILSLSSSSSSSSTTHQTQFATPAYPNTSNTTRNNYLIGLLDNLKSIIKNPTLYSISPANSILQPMFRWSNSSINSVSSSSNSEGDHNEQNSRTDDSEFGVRQVNTTPSFDITLNPTIPLSQPLPITNQTETLLESNYKRKYYQYKFKDMSNPRHLPFRNRGNRKNIETDQSSSSSYQNGKMNGINGGISHSNGTIKHSDQQLLNVIDFNENDFFSLVSNLIDMPNNNLTLQEKIQIKLNKIQILTDQFLLRVLSSFPNPSYDNYQEILPKQSNYERDIFIRKIFQQNPFLYRVLEIISIVNEISYWHAEKFIDYPSESSHFKTTCQLVQIISNAEFIVSPLNLSLDIFEKITPEEISYVLLTIWNFIRDYQPSPNHYNVISVEEQQLNESKLLTKRDFSNNELNVEPYCTALRSIFQIHIKELCYLYGRFFSSIKKSKNNNDIKLEVETKEQESK
eukprot:gene2458-3035_t